jgi:large subunit ribosomal protein L1
MSFDDEKLTANINVFVEQVRASKPAGVKGVFINGVTLSATMCPGIRVTI